MGPFEEESCLENKWMGAGCTGKGKGKGKGTGKMTKEKEAITFAKLIERIKDSAMKKNSSSGNCNCGYAVLRDGLEIHRGCFKSEFDFISGVLWGLYMVDVISEEERDILIDQLFEI